MITEHVGMQAQFPIRSVRLRHTTRSGVDLADIEEISASLRRWGDRYIRRLYTPLEQEQSRGPLPVMAASLAARFAAKESVRKILRATRRQPGWLDMEVRREAWGGCGIHLSGAAAEQADQEGICSWSLALSHERGLAIAFVVADLTQEV